MPSNNRKFWLFFFFAIGMLMFVWLNWFPPGADPDEQSAAETTALIDRREAEEQAIQFAQTRFGAGEWKAFAIFDQHNDAAGYLTKEKLTKQYERFWMQAVPMDYYRVQTRNEKSDLERIVFIRADNGTVFGWEAAEAETDAQSRPATPEDRQMIETELTALGYQLEQFRYDSERQVVIIYHHTRKIGQAGLALHLQISERNIDSLVPVFELPETFTKWKDRQDNKGAVTSGVSLLLWFGLAIAAIVYMAVYRSTMQFGRGIWLSIAFVIPYLFYNVNMYPGMKLSVPGLDGGFLFAVFFSQFLLMLMGVSVYLCLVAGDGLWRRMGFELWKHHRDHQFGSAVIRGVGLGYLFCFMVLGLQSVLFFIAQKLFDVWFGVDPLMSTQNLLWPGLYPLLAWSAAISEEAVFRLFAIAFFAALIRPLWRWIARLTGKPAFLHPLFYLVPAVTLASFLWALGHTGYSVYPVYTRLVEVLILGFVFSYIFIRYGLIAAIFAHASMDLIIMSLELMSLGQRFVLTGFFYILMPFIVGLLIRWIVRRRTPAFPTTHPE